MDAQFISNVGSIEIIVLRCQSDVATSQPSGATKGDVPKRHVSEKDDRRPSKAANARSSQSRAAKISAVEAAPESEIGGLFGLFDGACDIVSYDGSVDKRPSESSDRDRQQPPPGMVWDTSISKYVPECLFGPLRKGKITKAEIADGQLDGGERYRHKAMNEWQTRSRGSVSFLPDPNEITRELSRIKNKLVDAIADPSTQDQRQVEHELNMIMNLQSLQKQGQGSLAEFPHWLLEVLIDHEIIRKQAGEVLRVSPSEDLTVLTNVLDRDRANALKDRLLHKSYDVKKEDDCLALAFMLGERASYLSDALNHFEYYRNIPTGRLRERSGFVSMQRGKAEEAAGQMDRQAQAINRENKAHAADRSRAWDARSQTRDQAGYPTQEGANINNAGWQEVGAGTWHKDRLNSNSERRGQSDKKPNDHNAAWVWDTESKRKDGQAIWEKGSGKTHEHRFSDANKNEHNNRTRSINNVRADDQGDNAWLNEVQSTQHRNDKEREWADNKSSKSRSKSQAKESANQRGNQNTWTESPQQWATADDSAAKKADWKANSHHGFSSHGESQIQRTGTGDRDLPIKPYWQQWNKPPSQANAAQSNARKNLTTPREVYNYPASALPMVPQDKVKDASHGVQVSRGAEYSHKCHKPIYLDTMERPYAVFTFKYRSKAALEKILGISIDDSDVQGVQRQVEKDRLRNMPKEQLVEELMKRKGSSRRDSKGGANASQFNGWDQIKEKSRSNADRNCGWGSGNSTWEASGNANDGQAEQDKKSADRSVRSHGASRPDSRHGSKASGGSKASKQAGTAWHEDMRKDDAAWA